MANNYRHSQSPISGVTNVGVRDAAIRHQNNANTIKIIGTSAQEGESTLSVANQSREATPVKQRIEDRNDVAIEIWIRQNVFFYEFFTEVYCKVTSEKYQTVNKLGLKEILERLKAKADNAAKEVFERVGKMSMQSFL